MTHTTETTPNAEKIAAGLTEAQRKDLLASEPNERFWTADGRTMRGLERRGLVERSYMSFAHWTPLGLAVREILRRYA